MSHRSEKAHRSRRGYLYQVPKPSPGAKLSAFPTTVHRCEADWGRSGKDDPGDDPGRSPLSPHRTGFQKVNQVLADGLLRQMPDLKTRKLVVFTDSRQDAAKLSAGIELDHYRDLVRQSMVTSFSRLGDDVQGVPQVGRSRAEVQVALVRGADRVPAVQGG